MLSLDPKEATTLGLAVYVALIYLTLTVPLVWALFRFGIKRLSDGDGNGAPSLRKLEARLDERFDAVELRLDRGAKRMTRIERRLASRRPAAVKEG